MNEQAQIAKLEKAWRAGRLTPEMRAQYRTLTGRNI